MIGSGVNLVMTVIGFAVSTMFIVFVCTRLICARIQLSASRRSFPDAAVATRSDLGILERGLHGLEPVVVANFPTKKYGDVFFSFAEDTQCTVCLAEYQEKDVLRILPYCGHGFHVTCIDIWLQQHSTCPVCRISLRDSPPGRKHLMLPSYRAPARPHYTPETPDSGSYHCLSTGRRCFTRAADNQRMKSIQEDLFAPEPSEAGDTGSTLLTEETSHIVKDACCQQESGGKHVESPSDTT